MPSSLDDLLGLLGGLTPQEAPMVPDATPIPPAEVHPFIPLLQEILSQKYEILLCYIHYGDQLRMLARDGVFKHFQEHIEEEREQIYQLNKKLTAFGVHGVVDALKNPPKLDIFDDPKAVFEDMKMRELNLVAAWSRLFKMTTDDVALNAMAQEGALLDQQHADDMTRYLLSKQ